MSTEQASQPIDIANWAIMELMGHRTVAGYVTSVIIGSHVMIRIDIHSSEESFAPVTQFYNPSALYCLSPTTEEICRRYVANNSFTKPVYSYQLALPQPGITEFDDE
ncbi:MAG: hypothetical protein JNL32_00105 [Candidatus Kapabacteria bacterium]|nr:hypothetical protein [Candidatus Kapabacteria bacterium]